MRNIYLKLYFNLKDFLKKLLLAFFIVGGICVALYSAWFYLSEIAPFRGRDFNQKEWAEAFKSNSDHEYGIKRMECIRGAMVSDLKKNYLKYGTNRSIVTNLLGEADAGTGTSRSVSDQGFENCIQYDLGECSVSAPDSDYLYICFDRDQNIIKVNNIFHSA